MIDFDLTLNWISQTVPENKWFQNEFTICVNQAFYRRK